MRRVVKESMKRIVVAVLAVSVLLSFTPFDASAATRKNCDSKPSSGNAFIVVNGTFLSDSKESLLKRVNEIRKEACKEGVINPSTGKKLTTSDYVPIKWSSSLEKIAQLRAAEACVDQGHTRPNGNSCFTVKYDGVQSWGEVLAWNNSGMLQGIEQWYGEKSDWVNQNTSAVTGHYTQMIDPSNTYIGLGGFDAGDGDWLCVAGEFMSNGTISYMGLSSVSETKVGASGKCGQVIEVPKSKLNAKLSSTSLKLKKGKKSTLKVKMVYTTTNIYGSAKKVKASTYGTSTWTSSNKKVATVSSKGVVTAKKKGTATITVKTASGKKATCKVTVK